MSESVRETVVIQLDGRTTIPEKVREAVGLKGQKGFCQVENYGSDKILLTILSKWQPPK